MSETFPTIIGHPIILRLLESSLAHPAPSYLLVGPLHLGKRTIAEHYVCALLGLPTANGWKSHPDCIYIQPNEGKTQISVEQIRELRERVVLRPSVAPRVVVYIPQADRLNESGANALLKVVEEPPAGAVFVFVAEDLARIPRTLQSRSVILPVSRVAKTDIVDGLIARGVPAKDAEHRAIEARGLPGLAIEPESASSRGSDFVQAFISGRSIGARLACIEVLTKSCDEEDDSASAWKEALLQAMQSTEGLLARYPDMAGSLGIALVASLKLVGGAISPRIPLEACAVRLGEGTGALFTELQPQHISPAFSQLYSVPE